VVSLRLNMVGVVSGPIGVHDRLDNPLYPNDDRPFPTRKQKVPIIVKDDGTEPHRLLYLHGVCLAADGGIH
jgi:hypothetical protein